MRSELQQAKPFRRWVTKEVLPSIFRTGAYVTAEKQAELEENPEALKELLDGIKAERHRSEALEAKNTALAVVNKALVPKAAFHDALMLNPRLTTTRIALEYGLSAVKLNQILKDEGIQYRSGDDWCLQSLKYADHAISKDGGDEYVIVGWKQSARAFIRSLLAKHDIRSVAEVS